MREQIFGVTVFEQCTNLCFLGMLYVLFVFCAFVLLFCLAMCVLSDTVFPDLDDNNNNNDNDNNNSDGTNSVAYNNCEFSFEEPAASKNVTFQQRVSEASHQCKPPYEWPEGHIIFTLLFACSFYCMGHEYLNRHSSSDFGMKHYRFLLSADHLFMSVVLHFEYLELSNCLFHQGPV